MLHHEKFSKKSDLAFSSWNLTWEGAGSEEDAPERRGFRDEADLCLGAMRKLSERERERSKKVPINNNIKGKKRMICMHEKCMNM